ncbi:hypothetical protein Vretimale_5250 [Volvox reticuliferus]|uniref:Uncharacterized protein n=1 Tax=Volvox reticuliferus TaxID=1737510 RepID=A0A8J4C553_9CHLO|nr:hypothetical protein Vretifemale_3680 [Volvox reticuliferus]GIM00430.1 hypothetical protein Vretimale_5250 [Volvox reticuliferus]
MPIHGLPFTDEQLFNLINIVLPGWLILAVAPRWCHSQPLSAVAALLMSLLYAALLLSSILFSESSERLDIADMFTYKGVVRLLANRSAALPCWVHFAAFDLWVGRWITRDAVFREVPRILFTLCLLITMMFGPAGLLLYHLVRIPFPSEENQKRKSA